MYYRRKILLSVLKIFGGKLDKIDLQKINLVIAHNQSKPTYHFVPYKFGCYSFQINADLKTLEKYNITSSDENYWYLKDTNIEMELTQDDSKIIKYVFNQYKNCLGQELVRHTYLKYPYYAVNSLIKEKILTESELKKVNESKPANSDTGLYTIGYEGISLEEYLNKLIKYDIKVLCDVRRNSLSMKFGFSKNQLKNACDSINVQYRHFPELGIQSNLRKDLSSQSDYDNLFKIYVKNTISSTVNSQQILVDLIKEHKRIAITCFEADICKCHRLHLSNSLKDLPNFTYKVYHI